MADQLRRCSKCGQQKGADAFYSRGAWCKDCRRTWQLAYNVAHIDHVREYRRGWAKAARKRKYAAFRQYELRKKYKKYGLADGWYEQQLARQNGLCAICGKPETRLHNMTKALLPLSIDHDHETGRVRGLLCAVCNTRLHAGIEWYLQAHRYLSLYNGS